MQYAIVNGQRTAPAKGLKGICPDCKAVMNAKCGDIKLHHWAHDNRADCDFWWETETPWHRAWKEKFPENYREVTMRDELTFHRADIHTPKGVTIEFQHSSISLEELMSRVIFYKKMVWVVDGLPFINQIDKFPFPDPDLPELAAYEIIGYSEPSKFCMENTMQIDPRRFFGSLMLSDENGLMCSLRDKPFEDVLYSCMENPMHYLFDWRYKRKAWLDCTAPVFFDFGGQHLFWLKRRKHPFDRQFYFKLVSKERFVEHYT